MATPIKRDLNLMPDAAEEFRFLDLSTILAKKKGGAAYLGFHKAGHPTRFNYMPPKPR
jgi:hypothetical protein